MMEESRSSSSRRTQQQQHERRCGIIRFRPLNPSTDRKQIQKLHKEWFPVDYTEEFFDFLCHDGSTTTSAPPTDILPNDGMYPSTKSPLYCQVATFTQLTNEEYIKRKRRKEMKRKMNNDYSKKKKMTANNTTTTTMTNKLRLSTLLLWSYFWKPFSTSHHDASAEEDEHNDKDNDEIANEHYDDYDDDCIFWEEEESNGNENERKEQVFSKNDDFTIMQEQIIVHDNDDDDIEEGSVGVDRWNERREKERMIQFYANGCKKSNDDDDDESSDQYIMNNNTRVNGGIDGAATSLYSDDNDERMQKEECIIGCIIGTYLQSDMPSSNSNIHSSSNTNTNNNNAKHCNNSTPNSNIDGGDVLDDKVNDNRLALKIIPCRNSINRKNNITHPPPTTSRDETASLLISNPSIHPRMFYIMTLGTARNFRRYGLGSMLIESIITMIENEGTSTTTSSSSMGLEENDTYETAMQKGRALAMYSRPTQLTGVLYLHVIIYNTGAIRMYERLGFVRVKEIQDYYTINSVNYNCYLYARYFHGNVGHHHTRSKLDVMYCYAKSFVRSFLGY